MCQSMQTVCSGKLYVYVFFYSKTTFFIFDGTAIGFYFDFKIVLFVNVSIICQFYNDFLLCAE